jgi:hypothetical protein
MRKSNILDPSYGGKGHEMMFFPRVSRGRQTMVKAVGYPQSGQTIDVLFCQSLPSLRRRA